MADLPISTRSPTPSRAFEPDLLTLLGALPPPQAEAVRQLARDRDHLVLLHEALVEAERAPTLEARLRVFVAAVQRTGFGRAAITLRDAELNPTLIVTGGLTPEEDRALRQAPASGEVWRRRLAAIEPFRIGQSYYLDARQPVVAREFRDALPSRLPPGGDSSWTPQDSLVVPLRAGDGRVVGTLVLDDPADRARPTPARIRTVELFAQQIAHCVEQATLAELAQRRAGRLQRLQEVGGLLVRSLDEDEIVRELARQVGRAVPCDGIVVAYPDLERGTVTTALRLVRGVERPRPALPLGAGPIAEAARGGRAVRVADWDGAAPGDDVVGDAGRAGSVMAVPMMVGITLVGVLAVHAAARGAYGAEDEEVLRTVAGQAATAIVNARFYADSQRERRQSEALADAARAVSESLRLGEVLHLILRHATALLRTQGACVSLRDGDELEAVAGVGHGERLVGMRLPVAGSLSGRAVRQGTHVIVNDVAGEPEEDAAARTAAEIRRTIIVPLITAQGAIGALSVINREAEFSDDDARVLQRLADQVAVAIVNARLFEQVAHATREWTVAFDAIPGGMVVLDDAGRITRGNARALQLAGAAAFDSLLGRQFHEALFDEPEPCGECVHVAAMRAREVSRGTHAAVRRGKVFTVVAAPHPHGGAVVTFDDVTSHHSLAERHRRVVETASDAIVITDPQRRIAFANPAALELFGRAGTLVGTPVRETLAPEEADHVRGRQDAALAGAPQRYETVIVRPDGERRLVSVTAAPLREVGQVTGIVASLRDVTDERRARERIAVSEARYRNLFETAADAIYTLDARGTLTSANQATCDLTGHGRDELLGRTAEALLDPAGLAEVRAHFEAALAGESRRYECHLVRRDGARRLLSVANTPIRHGQKVIGVLGIARDLTADRERAAALERSEARYSHLVESASDAIFTVDQRGRFTSVNRALERSVGRGRDELLGESFESVVEPHDRDAMRELFERTMRGERQRGEFRYVHAAGAVRAGSVLTAPIAERGQVTGGLGIVRDVTEEQSLTAQLHQQEKLAAIGQLISGVAHELNNPLAGIMAFSQLLLASPAVSPDVAKALETIHQESRRAAKVVSNLLTFARQHPPRRRETDVNEVLLDTVELRRYALRVQQIELDVDLEPDLPRTWADPFQLQQVFLHLLANAEQVLTAWTGPRRIAARSRREGDLLLVSVEDTGPGIAPENLARLFNPFFTTKPVGQGTGLGLSVSDGIVRGHGGRIRVESRPGHGAAFVVELPIVARDAEPERLPLPGRAADGRGHAILVVDDEPSIRSALLSYLGALGHTAEAVSTGRAALERVRAGRYDAILLDLRMPDMPGDAVYAAIKAHSPEQAARVVFVTGDVQSDAGRAFIRATGRPCLNKPFLLDELAAVLFRDAVAPSAA